MWKPVIMLQSVKKLLLAVTNSHEYKKYMCAGYHVCACSSVIIFCLYLNCVPGLIVIIVEARVYNNLELVI